MEEPSLTAAASSAAAAYETDQSTSQEDEIADPAVDQQSTTASTDLDRHELESNESKPKFSQSDIVRAVEVVERDSLAIADSFSSLFSSLRLALSEVTSCSVDHMQCFADAAGQLQETTLDAATKGNRYINSCLRLNEEMKGVDGLATRLKILRRNVDALDSAVNKLVRPP